VLASLPMTRPSKAPVLLLAALIPIAALVYSFHFTSFLHPKELALGLGLLVIALIAPAPRMADFQMLLPLWLLLLLGAVHLFTAQVPQYVVEELGRWGTLLMLATFAVPCLRNDASRVVLLHALLASTVLVAIVGLLQFSNQASWLFPTFTSYTQQVYSVFGNQDLFGGYCALGLVLAWQILPTVRKSWPRQLLALALWLVLLAALAASGARSAWLAAAVGTLTMCRSQGRRPNWRTICLGAAAASILLLWMNPVLHLEQRLFHTFSAEDVGGRIRLWIWDGTLRMFADSALIGAGWGNFRFWSPSCLAEALQAPYGHLHLANELQAVQAHSEPMQLLAEGGMVAAALLFWFLGRLVQACRRARRELRPALIGGLAVLCTFSLFNDPWHAAPHALAALLLAAALLAAPLAEPAPPQEPRRSRWPWALIALALLLLNTWTTYLPSYLLARAEKAHVTGQDPLTAYARAVSYPWEQPRAREQYALALLEHAKAQEATTQLHLAVQGQDTGQVHLYRALAAAALGDTASARSAFAECLHRFPRNEAVWWRLRALTPPAEWPRLQAHARRWLPQLGEAYPVGSSPR
jgi:O-antigen polymerase